MSVKDGQDRLRHIAKAIESDQLPAEADRNFIVQALSKIADGEDAKQALNVKAKRGERTSKASQARLRENSKRNAIALGWLAAAKCALDEEGLGLGLTFEQALNKLENDPNFKIFCTSVESLRDRWNHSPTSRKPDFILPD